MIKRKYFVIALILAVAMSSISIYDGIQYHKTVKNLKKENNQMAIVQNELQNELTLTKNGLKIEVEKNDALSKELGNIKHELDTVNITLEDLKSDEYEFVYLGEFKLTAYCTELYPHICGTGTGNTATGTTVTPGRTIGVDPNVIPYGTKVYIEGVGWRVAEDTGSAIKDKHIDVAVDTHENANDHGVKSGGVWVLVEKS